MHKLRLRDRIKQQEPAERLKLKSDDNLTEKGDFERAHPSLNMSDALNSEKRYLINIQQELGSEFHNDRPQTNDHVDNVEDVDFQTNKSVLSTSNGDESKSSNKRSTFVLL